MVSQTSRRQGVPNPANPLVDLQTGRVTYGAWYQFFVTLFQRTGTALGTATLIAGTALIKTKSVTANSRIFITAQDNSTTGSLRISSRNPGSDFTITSSNPADVGMIAYEIFEPY